MRVLFAYGSGPLARRLPEALGARHEVSIPDADPRDRDAAASATSKVDAVVCGLPDVPPGHAGALLALDRASRGVYNLISTAAAAGVRRFVILSSLRPFERYPLDHAVTEYWAPRPTTDPEDLLAVVAEAVVREASHVLPIKAVCLRLATVVESADSRDPRAVHVEDVVQAIELALAFEPLAGEPPTGWWPFHIVGAGRTRFPLGMANGAGRSTAVGMPSLGYTPAHDVSGGARPTATVVEPPRRFTAQIGGAARRVVIFGAGGPLAAITALALDRDHTLRLCDRRPLADIVAEGRPQSRGAPFPRLLGQPHELREVDVTDYGWRRSGSTRWVRITSSARRWSAGFDASCRPDRNR
jgi:hypothetical protein